MEVAIAVVRCDTDETTRQEFLNELCPRVRPLIACVMDCDCGCQVLDFFRQRKFNWLELSDVAYYLRQPDEQVVAVLNRLVEIRMMERLKVLGSTFYGLTRDPDTLLALEQFWVWRDDRRAHLERVADALQLRSMRESRTAS